MADTSAGSTDPTDLPVENPTPPPFTEVIDNPSGAPEEHAGERLVPLAEVIRLRKRAQEAEARALELAARIGELEQLVQHTRQALDAVERRHRIDQALLEADAIDLESARLLTELALGQMEAPDEAAAVAELRGRKPFLFRARPARTGSYAMSGRTRQATAGSLLEAAAEAGRSGDRRAVLRYLEARRNGAAG